MADNNVKVILGSHGSGKSDCLYNHFLFHSRKKVGENKTIIDFSKKFYLVVPEQDTNDKQRLMMHYADKLGYGAGILNIDVVSFDRIAHNVFDILNIEPASENVIEDDAKTMILALVLARLNKKGLIKYYKRMVNKVGFAKKLTQVVSEFYSYNIKAEDIDKVMDKEGDSWFKDKLSDLKLIYEEFKLVLKQKEFSIKEDKYNLLNDNIDKVDIFNDSCVAFDGFTGFTPIQLEIFKKIAMVAKEVYVTIDVRDPESIKWKSNNPLDVFYLSEKFVNDLSNSLTEIGKTLLPNEYIIKNDVIKFKNKPDLAFLEKYIYDYSKVAVSKDIVPEHIECYEAKNIDVEVKNTARLILDYVRTNKYRYNDIRIIVPNITDYSDHILKTFNKYNIPLFIDDSTQVLNSPYIEAIRAAIDVVNYDFSYDSVMRYINSGIYTKGPIIDHIDNLIRQYGIRGIKRYKDGFDKINIEGTDKFKAKIIEKKNELFNPLFKFYDALKSSKTIVSYVNAINDFIKEINLVDRFEKFVKQVDYTLKDDNDHDRQLSILDASFNITKKTLSNLLLINADNDEEIEIEELKRVLDVGFISENVKSIPYKLDQVVVGDVMRSRFDNPKVMFFLGLNQSKIPAKSSDLTLIDDMMRKKFDDQHIVLSQTTEETALNQRFYTYLALTNPTEKLILSYPRINASGDADQKSPVLNSVERLFGEKVKDDKTGEEKFVSNIVEKKVDDIDFGFFTISDVEDYVLEKVRITKDNGEVLSDELKNAIKYLKDNDQNYSLFIEKLMKQRDFIKEQNLDEQLVSKLFNLDKIDYKLSASSVETYNTCPYKYFMNYGLGLKERETYEIGPIEMGNYFHKAFELIFKDHDKLSVVADSDLEEIVEKALDEATILEPRFNELNKTDKDYFGANKLEFIKEKSKKTLLTSIKILKKISVSSKLSAAEEECKFDYTIDNHNLYGKIDKIETYVDDKKVYVNILDYKSGSKAKVLDIKEVESGVNIQLMLYLDYAINDKYKTENKAISCGAFYFWVADPIVMIESLSEKNKLLEKKNDLLSYVGFANSDENTIKIVDDNLVVEKTKKKKKDDVPRVKHIKTSDGFSLKGKILDESGIENEINIVHQKIDETFKDIADGRIDANPFTLQKCDFCPYSNICKRELKIKDDGAIENTENDGDNGDK